MDLKMRWMHRLLWLAYHVIRCLFQFVGLVHFHNIVCSPPPIFAGSSVRAPAWIHVFPKEMKVAYLSLIVAVASGSDTQKSNPSAKILDTIRDCEAKVTKEGEAAQKV